MSKTPNCKRKLPILAKLLLERSDEDHPITRQDMQDELARWGLSAERKSLYDDMEQLRELGLDVQAKRGRNGGWYIGQRDFELAELKLCSPAGSSPSGKATCSSASWRGWPASIRPGSSSGRSMWTAG